MAASDRAQSPRPTSPIAIVGLACRLPHAPTPAAFWRLLCGAENAVSPLPAGRWTAGPQAAPSFAGLLDRVDMFDAGFFGVPPREALAMDPQQRLMLELAWEALEDAGDPPGDAGRQPYRGLRRRHLGRLRGAGPPSGTGRGHPVHHDRPAPQHHRQPGLTPPGAARAEPHGGRGAVLRAGGRAPGLREPAAGGCRPRAGRRGEPDPDRGQHAGRRRPVLRAVAGRQVLHLRRAGQRLRARRGRRRAAAQAAGDRGRGRRHGVLRDPGQRRQQRR